MRHTSQDIYGTGHDRDGSTTPPGEERDAKGRTLWDRRARAVRLQSMLFGLAVFLLASFIAATILYSYHERTRIRGTSASANPEISANAGEQKVAGLDLSADPREVFVTDELSELKERELPEEGDLPLAARWIKQAAFQLVQGEKAVEENRLDEALAHFEKALWIYPELKGVQRQIGLIHIRNKAYAPAAEAFEKAAREETLSFGIANNLGVAYLQLEEFDKAEEAIRQALKLKPEYAAAIFNLGTLYLRTGELEKAEYHLKRYLEKEPSDIKAAYSYAFVLVQLEDWEMAATMLSQLVRHHPDSPPVYFRLAQALYHVDHQEEAVKALERGSALVDPRNALAWLNRTEYDGLRDHPDFQALASSLDAKVQ